MPSDREYRATKQIMLNKAIMNPEFVDLYKMKRLTLIFTLFILAGSFVATAQTTNRYFLNKTEIAPESVFFFKQDEIDSICQFTDKDTTVVFYTHRPEKFLSYQQLLDLHQIDESARKLPVDLSEATSVRNPEKMVFLADRVSYISIIYSRPSMTKKVFISPTFEYWDQNSDKGKMLLEISSKFNNIEP
jgi:hypothetical protein